MEMALTIVTECVIILVDNKITSADWAVVQIVGVAMQIDEKGHLLSKILPYGLEFIVGELDVEYMV